MKIQIIGFDHRNSPEMVRSNLAAGLESISGRIADNLQQKGLNASGSEFFLIITCNRVELFGVFPQMVEDQFLYQTLLETELISATVYQRFSKVYSGIPALNHFFRVWCGFESFRLGETAVALQIRQGFKFARDRGYCNQKIQYIIKQAQKLNQQLWNQRLLTNPDEFGSSVVRRITQEFDFSKQCQIILWGSGVYLGSLAARFEEMGVGFQIESKLNLSVEEVLKTSRLADVILITELNQPDFIVLDQLTAIDPDRILIVDLGVARDFEPAVEVYYNLVNLEKLTANFVEIDDLVKLNEVIQRIELLGRKCYHQLQQLIEGEIYYRDFFVENYLDVQRCLQTQLPDHPSGEIAKIARKVAGRINRRIRSWAGRRRED